MLYIGKMGVNLGLFEEQTSEDHPDHGEAIQVTNRMDERGARAQKQRHRIMGDERTSWLEKQKLVAELGQAERQWINGAATDSPALHLRVARLHAGEAEYALIQGSRPADKDRAREIREKFERRSPEQRLDILRRALNRHERPDLELLAAVLEELDLLSAVPEGIRPRLASIVLELADPAAHRRWKRLVTQLDRLEEAMGVATRYWASDANLSLDERRVREEDEARRRRHVINTAQRV